MTYAEAIKICEQWFAYIERQKQNTEKLQKAASLARKGDKEGAKRLKNEVDNQPKIYDGETLLPAVKHLLQAQSEKDRVMKEMAKALGSLLEHESGSLSDERIEWLEEALAEYEKINEGE